MTMKTLNNFSPPYSDFPCTEILGICINKLSMDDVIEIAKHNIKLHRQLVLGVVNVAKLVNARKNSDLRISLEEADIVLADGSPIVWLSRILRKALPERVAGIDLMYALLDKSNSRGYRVYFLGAKCEVLQKVITIVRRDYPNLKIAGYRDGYFSPEEEQTVADEIRKSNADIIFVAICSPKKEIFLRKWKDFIKVPICHGVGGSFDVLAGVTKRAPLWMRKCGLEWLYRLNQEPRRMWRRYLVTNSIFLFLSFKLIFGTKLKQMISKFRHRADRIC